MTLDIEVCWPWHLRYIEDYGGHPKGGRCLYCQRDIAIPPKATRGSCLYCALERGLTPAIDEPFA